jgi:hypothetical protein
VAAVAHKLRLCLHASNGDEQIQKSPGDSKKLHSQWYTAGCARVAELVDAHGSGPCIARCGDSSSLPGTKITQSSKKID